MPHVASDSKSHALNRPFAPTTRPTVAAERAAASPFESLIDDTPAPAPEPRAEKSQRAANDNPPRADRANGRQDTDRPAQSRDKAAEPADSVTKTAKAADAEAPAKTETADAAAPSEEAPAEEKTAEAAAGDVLQSAGDDATVDGKTADIDTGTGTDAVAAPVPTQTQTQTPAQTPVPAAAAAAIAVAPAPVATPETAPVTDEPVAINADAAKSAPQAALPLKAGKKTDDGKPVADANPDADAKLTADAKLAAETKPVAETKPAAEAVAKVDTKADAKPVVKTEANAAAPLDPEAVTPPVNSEASKAAAASARGEAVAERPGHAKPDAAPVTTDGNVATPKQAPDIVQPSTLTAQANGAVIAAGQATAAPAAAAVAASAATDTQEPAVPLSGVAIEITNKALGGKNQFDIRLDPPELGRIHVRLEVDKDGNVISHLVADRTDTLDMLRRDSAGLDRALQDAGLKTSGDSLQFSLRDQDADQQQDNGGGNTAHLIAEDESTVSIEATARDYARYGARAGGLDIRV